MPLNPQEGQNNLQCYNIGAVFMSIEKVAKISYQHFFK